MRFFCLVPRGPSPAIHPSITCKRVKEEERVVEEEERLTLGNVRERPVDERLGVGGHLRQEVALRHDLLRIRHITIDG